MNPKKDYTCFGWHISKSNKRRNEWKTCFYSGILKLDGTKGDNEITNNQILVVDPLKLELMPSEISIMGQSYDDLNFHHLCPLGIPIHPQNQGTTTLTFYDLYKNMIVLDI